MGEIRVLCGGYGFSAYNWIGLLRNDLDVFQTAEGDGTVLHQQQAKFLLKNYKRSVADFGGKHTLLLFLFVAANIGSYRKRNKNNNNVCLYLRIDEPSQ